MFSETADVGKGNPKNALYFFLTHVFENADAVTLHYSLQKFLFYILENIYLETLL